MQVAAQRHRIRATREKGCAPTVGAALVSCGEGAGLAVLPALVIQVGGAHGKHDLSRSGRLLAPVGYRQYELVRHIQVARHRPRQQEVIGPDFLDIAKAFAIDADDIHTDVDLSGARATGVQDFALAGLAWRFSHTLCASVEIVTARPRCTQASRACHTLLLTFGCARE
jgi:hypothetical protein